MVKSPASAPSSDHVSVVPASTSEARNVLRAVMTWKFSSGLMLITPEPITGASLTLVRLIVTVMLSSVAVSALPAESLLSRTLTVTL